MIAVLPPHVAALIAAGEVIHSPRDVLKELIENALDAGSTALEITLRYGGIEGIRVTDNGSGLSSEDLLLAPQRHATSKIRSTADLLDLSSFGFRGEGLYSIAAVSNFTMGSRRKSDAIGSKISIALPDRESSLSECSMNIGTFVQCDQLFAPIPVRRKLLKSPRVELKRSLEIIRSLLLVHPEVQVHVFDQQEVVLTLHEASLDFPARLTQAFPLTRKSLWKNCKRSFDQGCIEGWYYAESTKGLEQQWYINKRWFSQSAFIRIAQRYIEHGILIIQLSLKPEYIDVNLHPQKHHMGFYLQDSLLSSLGDFFMDWLGLPCPIEDLPNPASSPVAITESIAYPSSVVSSAVPRQSSSHRGVKASFLQFEKTKITSVKTSALPQQSRSQILFLDQTHALLRDRNLILFNPLKLLSQMIQQTDFIDLIEPFYIKSQEKIAIFHTMGLCNPHGRVDSIPRYIDRYTLLAWLSEEKNDILRLYELLKDSFMHFVHDQSEKTKDWIQSQECFLGVRTLQDLFAKAID
jgi:DNA mismatch repair protein MutL